MDIYAGQLRQVVHFSAATMAHYSAALDIRGMPTEMLAKTYNLYQLENQGINLADHPDYRTYKTLYEKGIAPPTHKEMADIIIQALR